ncbi:Putative cytochrome P450 [Colletotrichum destructivum]|uniref:Cytochrome P450 n=1 Tax=Colletotrichum destructivum TaxID=34406 RepID=A0AAX4IJN0_9PEZI|nr:Putative cytochrome P450 [Colletotrichum destructivum]
MGPLYTALILLPTLWIASHLRALYNNYRAALLTGLPIIICPYDPESFIIAVFCVPARPLLKRVLPARAFAAVELTIFGWEFRDKAAVHARVGPAFVVVTTGLNQLICADPAMAHAILARRREFVQPAISIKVMSFLGMNILTSNGESWSRQRRIVAPALNERISPDVWRETAEQATFLVDLLLSPPSSSSSSDPLPPHTPGTSDTIPGLRSVAINVLTRIAYGHRKPFALPSLPRDPRAPMSYVDAISLVTQLLVPSAFVPVWLLSLPVMPRLLRTLGAALARMPALTADMLDQERRRAAEQQQQQQQQDTTAAGGNHAPDTIMSMLVRLSDQEKKSQAAATAAADDDDDDDAAVASRDKKTAAATANKTYLTEDEIAGNLFIFTAAGFDTTANTLAYAVTLLAAHPEWQAWIRAEIDAVLGPPGPQDDDDDDDGKGELPDYATAFPKLTRCLAVMVSLSIPLDPNQPPPKQEILKTPRPIQQYETLRLFPPLTHLMRSNETTQTMSYPSATDSSPSSSSTSPSSFTLRAPCAIYINTVALHTSPSTWGPDALTFNPARWLQPSVSGYNDSEAPQQQHLMTPPRGAFLPWSGGPRVCPGQKMSHVEFVTVIATLFRRCTAEPVPREGESMPQARQRLLDLTQDSQPILTLQMNRPQDVRLRWTKR